MKQVIGWVRPSPHNLLDPAMMPRLDGECLPQTASGKGNWIGEVAARSKASANNCQVAAMYMEIFQSGIPNYRISAPAGYSSSHVGAWASTLEASLSPWHDDRGPGHGRWMAPPVKRPPALDGPSSSQYVPGTPLLWWWLGEKLFGHEYKEKSPRTRWVCQTSSRGSHTKNIKNLRFLEILTAVISIFGSLKILLNLSLQTSEVMISTHYIYIHCKPSAIISLIFHRIIYLSISFRSFCFKSLKNFRRNTTFSKVFFFLLKYLSKFSSIVVLFSSNHFFIEVKHDISYWFFSKWYIL